MNSITVRKSFGSYNDRRYSKPWGAQVTLGENRPQYDYSVGTYWGDANGGEVVLTVPVASIVAFGQKDNYNLKKTKNIWYQVGEDGSLREVTRPEASIILSTQTEEEDDMKKITKSDLISQFRSLNLSETKYTDDQLNDMTKAAILEVYNQDLEWIKYVDEIRILGGLELSRKCLIGGTKSQLHNIRVRMEEYAEMLQTGLTYSLPELTLGEISVALKGHPITSWLHLAEEYDSYLLMFLYPEVFPRMPLASTASSTDRVLSIVATIISSVAKKTVSKDELLSPTYAQAAITVLEGRQWSEEDVEPVGHLLAELKHQFPNLQDPKPFTAPCDTNFEGFTYDQKSVVCQVCPDVQVCSDRFIQTKIPQPKRDVLAKPSAMTIITMRVVENPSVTKDEIVQAIKDNGARMPTDDTITLQMGEARKHVRILAMLGYLKEEYTSKIPQPKRDVLAKPSAVTLAAITSAQDRGTRDFETVNNLVQASDRPISRDAVYYQYQDSQKVFRLVKEMGVFVEG